jgi:uncharacterized delta-60 repeat protein
MERTLHFLSAVLVAAAGFSQSGAIDPDFGTNGIATIGNAAQDDWAEAVLLQPDGRIVIAGYSQDPLHYLMVARFNADGSLDTSFGNGGRTLSHPAYYNNYTDLALQPDGKILAAGRFYNSGGDESGIVGRYLPDGSPDSTFGVHGFVTVDVDTSNDVIEGVALQSDGAILLPARAQRTGSGCSYASCRTATWIPPSVATAS